jgi:signal peptidase I
MGDAAKQKKEQPMGRMVIHSFLFFSFLTLFTRALFLEVFTLKTGSMEPTLIGRLDQGDTVLLCPLLGTPSNHRRFDVLKFEHPNNRRVTYLKRLLGLPGDQIFFHGGDLYLADESFGGTLDEGLRIGRVAILRKPDQVQEDLFAVHPIAAGADLDSPNGPGIGPFFEEEDSGQFVQEGRYRRSNPDRRGILEYQRPLVNGSRDAASVGGDILLHPGQHPVGDLSVTWELTADSKRGAFTIEIWDPWQGVPVALRWDLETSEASLLREDRVLGSTRVPALTEARTVTFENVDDRLRLKVDGRLALERHFSHALRAPAPREQTRLRFFAENASLLLRPISILRDIHYLPGPAARVIVPPGKGFFLGDHVASSADSRLFGRVAIEDLRTGIVLLGDRAGATASSVVLNPSNPWQDVDGSWIFCDLLGRHHVFPDDKLFRKVASWSTPFVPLDALKGRAVAVLWPMSRMKWLR